MWVKSATTRGRILKKFLRALLVSAASCSVAASTLIVGGAAPAQAKGLEVNADACANVTVLGVRASNAEENRRSSTTPNNGRSGTEKLNEPPADKFGFINTKAVDYFQGMLSEATTIKRVVVNYTPSKFDFYVTTADEVADHQKAIASAKAAIVNAVSDTLRDCHQTKIVVIGYGQGAEAAHQAVSLIPSGQQASLAAVWLMSDPLLNVKDANQLRYYGNAPLSTVSGAMIDIRSQAAVDSTRQFRAQLAPKDTTFPASLTGKVVSVCSAMDSGCSSNTGAYSTDPMALYTSTALIARPAKFVVDALDKLCNDVTFFAARGSGEPFHGEGSGYPVANEGEAGFTSTASDYKQGFGTVLATMARAIESKFSWGGEAPTFGHIAVDYEAIDVAKAVGMNSGYPRSVNTGIDPGTGPEQLRQLIKQCPETKVVMLGYSQGGHVIHEVTMRLTAEERKHVSMVVLVADAIRNPDDDGALTFMGRPVQFETKDSVIYNGMGAMRTVALADTVCLANNALTDSTILASTFFRLVNFISAPPFCIFMPQDVRFSDVVSPGKFPDDMNHKVLNVCSNLDIICDAETAPGGGSMGFNSYKLANLVGLLQQTSVHGEFYKKPGFYDFPASWAASKLLLPQVSR